MLKSKHWIIYNPAGDVIINLSFNKAVTITDAKRRFEMSTVYTTGMHYSIKRA